ncbi:MAG: amidase [Alphaproteobacteria bacterium]|nr:amidase [Alphaproteobacteria bacterium]
MDVAEYVSHDAVGLARLVQRGEVRPLELLDAALARIGQWNGPLNAVVAMREEAARAEAAALSRDRPLAGVPFLLKDFLALLAGFPTTNGAGFLRHFVPQADSLLVERYRRAGLVMLGKTNTPEMAISASTEPRLFGPTRNPWDTARSAGGSSGGSAAAVAAGMVPAAHATDGGGSIRIPAAACGLVGLKPTRGRISMAPLLGESLAGAAAEHVVTRSVRDTAALLDISHGAVHGDPYAAAPPPRPYLEELHLPVGRLRIAVSAEPPYPCKLDHECRKGLEDTARLLEDLGHIVEEATPPTEPEALDSAFLVAMSVNIASTIELRAAGRPHGPGDFEPVTWAMIERGRKYSGIDYLRAVQTFHRLGRLAAPFFARHDLLLTPTLATLPPPLGHLDTDMTDLDAFLARLFSFAPFTRLWNVTGQPAISLPLAWTGAGLPVGMQFVARAGEEATLLRLAAELERARPWKARYESLFRPAGTAK